jgi:H+-transporting ATPase
MAPNIKKVKMMKEHKDGMGADAPGYTGPSIDEAATADLESGSFLSERQRDTAVGAKAKTTGENPYMDEYKA